MLKKYQGKANRQADKLAALCFCEFVAVGFPLHKNGCEVHSKEFGCDYVVCSCTCYRPNTVKQYPTHWPRCVCGHLAQDHNTTESNNFKNLT